MHKNLLAMAIAATITIPSIAAAEVTVFGRAQLELVNTTGDKTEGLTLDDAAEGGVVGKGNASEFGVMGNHDLGNGMAGIYKVNFNFWGDDGASGLGTTGRDQYVGLKGEFGTVMAGRISTPYKTSTVKYDPFLSTFMQARGSNGMSGLHNSYADNVIAYANNFGDVKFVGAIALDESSDNKATEYDADHAVTASVVMPVMDSLELALAFMSVQAGNVANADNGTATKVGLKWSTGDITLAGQYEILNEELGDQSNMFVSAAMALGNGATVAASFGSQMDESSSSAKDGTYAAIGYKKAISKAVSWHAGIVMIDEGVVGAGKDVSQVGAGLRVKF